MHAISYEYICLTSAVLVDLLFKLLKIMADKTLGLVRQSVVLKVAFWIIIIIKVAAASKPRISLNISVIHSSIRNYDT